MADMTQQTAAPVQTPAPPVKPQQSKESKQRKRRAKNLIIAVILLAIAAVGIFFLYRFLTTQNTVESEIQTQVASISSIQSVVSGSGNARAKESAAITLTQGGTVQEVLVAAGDTVTVGQPLYTIRSQEAEDAVATAQEKVDNLQKDMSDLVEKANNLTVRAPFAGKLVEVSEFQTDQKISEGETVCTLANDKRLKLSLYFSYAYENDISVGQSATVSIPAVMTTFPGTVEKINKVSYISPEGSVYFEVVVVFDNPNTLTADMTATATLTAADGTPIYPYSNSTTEYYEVRKITTEAGGPLISQNLLRYANVNAGDPLLVMGSDTIDSDIRAKQKEIDDATESLVEAQKALSNFNATAPIDGTVTSCTLTPGAEVKSGETVITISNSTNMVVEITVDDRNISFVQPGMTVDLTDYNGNTFLGTVSSIDMSIGDNSANGMTSYPVTLDVDNSAGTLLAGMWLDYSFVASQSNDCIVVPMQAVKYVSAEDGSTYTVIFIRSDEKPENAVDLDIPETEPGQTPSYPSPEDGFYAVPVTTGLSDNYNVEIKDGLQGGEEVFVNYYVNDGSSYG
ncbi:HlyD family efflux transporter periplasmic adaptor subunit [uncultured Intestinimonas sp.]|uniref:HlyD family efflux transporter periplasmic adaptor subunit n=1 Tax=uncultured Intestinimonas sp. TaxID=1689265 RepID=UPI0025F39E0B|nr:HlyD family efflux transporter periplasmic adaptor subunit [uncultured Intestinimonas sp.]